MQGCDDHAAVMDALRKLFVHVSDQGAITITDRTVKFCLFHRFRIIFVEQYRSHPHFDAAVNMSWKWNWANHGFSSCQREAIYLNLYAGFSFPEIAAIMSIDINEVYHLVSSSIESIRKTKHELNKSISPIKRLEVLNEL